MIRVQTTAAAGSLIAILAIAGCEKDFRPKDVDIDKVEAAVKSLSHEDFDKLNSTEKFDFLTIITKVHNVPYVIGPADVQLTVNERPGAYEESLFKLHETDKVAAFLEAELNKHLDNAAKAMASDDATARNREARLVNRLAGDTLQALLALNLSQEYRRYKELAGPQAPDPYMAADYQLVNTADTGAIQLYMAAAKAGDQAKLTEIRTQIDAVYKPFKDKTVDFTPPKAPASMRPSSGL